jgi:hypothetical protein
MDDAAVTTDIVYPELDESGVAGNADDDGATEPSEEGQAEQKPEAVEATEPPKEEAPRKEAKPTQSPEENAKWKAKRLEWESKEKAETEKLDKILKPFGAKSYDELSVMTEAKIDENTIARLKAEAYEKGIDEEFYLRNYQNEQDLKLFKAQQAAKAAEHSRKTAQSTKIQQDIAEFNEAYPEVSVQELMKNSDFLEINEGVLGQKSMRECYERYQKYQGKIADVAKDQAAKLLAKKNASAGSLKGNADNADEGFYSLEQMKKMSSAELDRNWDKVQKSYDKIYKH